jgi:hypothetical protein
MPSVVIEPSLNIASGAAGASPKQTSALLANLPPRVLQVLLQCLKYSK